MEEKTSKVKDLTTGNALKLILAFAFPILISALLQQVYNIVDAKIVGKALGENAYAAVGSTASLYNLFIGFAGGVTYGFSIIIAKKFGSKAFDTMKRTVATAYFLTLIFSVATTLLAVFTLSPILKMLKTPNEIFDFSKTYLMIIFLGLPITYFYNMFANALRALGNSLMPLAFLAIAVVANIGLDVLFIMVFQWGIAGAGYATIFSQFIAMALCFFYINRKMQIIKISLNDFKFNVTEVKNMLSLGVSIGAMNSFVSLGSIFMQRAINGFGIDTIVAHTSARRIDEMLMQPLGSLGNATATFVSQNYGSGKTARVREGVKKAFILGAVWSALAFAISFFFGGAFVQWISNTTSEEVVNIGQLYLNLNVPFFIFLVFIHMFRSAIQGVGNGFVPFLTAIIEFIVKIIFSFGLVELWDYYAICFAEPVSWALMAGLSVWYYVRMMRKIEKKNLEAENENQAI